MPDLHFGLERNSFVCRSGPEREAPSDDLIVRQLIPEINPEVNETRIQDANTTLSRLCDAFTSKISLLLSNCKAGYLLCTFAVHVGRYRTIDGYIEETSPDFPTARLTQPREFQEVCFYNASSECSRTGLVNR